jgi:hypothetical protein
MTWTIVNKITIRESLTSIGYEVLSRNAENCPMRDEPEVKV